MAWPYYFKMNCIAFSLFAAFSEKRIGEDRENIVYRGKGLSWKIRSIKRTTEFTHLSQNDTRRPIKPSLIENQINEKYVRLFTRPTCIIYLCFLFSDEILIWFIYPYAIYSNKPLLCYSSFPFFGMIVFGTQCDLSEIPSIKHNSNSSYEWYSFHWIGW